MSPAQQKFSSRRTLLIVAAIFILPLIAAKIVLMQHWYDAGVTNKGHLLDPPLSISAVDNTELPDNWRIGVLIPSPCDAACEHGLYVINQSYIALGRLQERVSPVGIQYSAASKVVNNLPSNTRLEIFTLPNAFEKIDHLPAGSLFIMDPLGNIMLWYDGNGDREFMIMQARDLLSDLKKMLKLSRVG